MYTGCFLTLFIKVTLIKYILVFWPEECVCAGSQLAEVQCVRKAGPE